MGFTSEVFSRNFYERKTAPKTKSSIEFQNSILEIDSNYFSVGNPSIEQKEMVETASQHNENYAL